MIYLYFFIKIFKRLFLVSPIIESKINFPFPLIVIVSPSISFLESLNSFTPFIKTFPSFKYSWAFPLEQCASSDTKLSNRFDDIIILINSNCSTLGSIKSIGTTDGGGIYLTGSSTVVNVNSDVAISGNKFKRFAAIYVVSNSTFNAISETANFTMESNEVGGEYSSAIYALSATINISRPQLIITSNVGGTRGSVYLNNTFFNVAGYVYINGNKSDNNTAVRNIYLDGTGNSSIGVYNNGKLKEESYMRVYKPFNLANTLVFTNWNEANVESYNTGEFFFPENLIGVDEELVEANWHIYRYGTGSLLYIGLNYVNLKFIYLQNQP